MKCFPMVLTGLLFSVSGLAQGVPATFSLNIQCDGINGKTHSSDPSTFDLQTVLESTEQIYGNPLVQSGYSLAIRDGQLYLQPAEDAEIRIGAVSVFPSQCVADQETTWGSLEMNPALQVSAVTDGSHVSATISMAGKVLVTLHTP